MRKFDLIRNTLTAVGKLFSIRSASMETALDVTWRVTAPNSLQQHFTKLHLQ